MPLARFLHGLDDGLVDAEGDGDAQQGQQQVGDHADDAEGCQRQQQEHRQTKHDTRLLGVSPVDQILHCTGGRRGKGGGVLDVIWAGSDLPYNKNEDNMKR